MELQAGKTVIDGAEGIANHGAHQHQDCNDYNGYQNKNERVLYKALAPLSQPDFHVSHLLSNWISYSSIIADNTQPTKLDTVASLPMRTQEITLFWRR